jgi:hypothetical protein
MTTPNVDANDLLMGAGVPSVKFKAVGDTVTGEIIRKPSVQQMRDFKDNSPLFWDDGNPKLQIIITLATDDIDPTVDNDDGVRNLYAKAQMQAAIGSAVRKAGAKRLEQGGRLTITFVREVENPNKKMNAQKVFSASYIPPSANGTTDSNLEV